MATDSKLYYVTIPHAGTEKVTLEEVSRMARQLGENDLHRLYQHLQSVGYVLLRPTDPTRNLPVLVTAEVSQ
jgi:hypothetical protein